MSRPLIFLTFNSLTYLLKTLDEFGGKISMADYRSWQIISHMVILHFKNVPSPLVQLVKFLEHDSTHYSAQSHLASLTVLFSLFFCHKFFSKYWILNSIVGLKKLNLNCLAVKTQRVCYWSLGNAYWTSFASSWPCMHSFWRQNYTQQIRKIFHQIWQLIINITHFNMACLASKWLAANSDFHHEAPCV